MSPVIVLEIAKNRKLETMSWNFYETAVLSAHKDFNRRMMYYYFVDIPENPYIIDKFSINRRTGMQRNSFYVDKKTYKFIVHKVNSVPVYVIFSDNTIKIYPKKEFDV